MMKAPESNPAEVPLMLRFAGGVLVLLAAGAQAQAPKVVLVELFTSEGCSSCPPADALLAKLAGHQFEGSLVVGLSEHVTYWNSLGWRDPWSQELFTQRQNGYGDRFQLRSVYTPQIVVNGARQVLGSDAAAVGDAVRRTGDAAVMLNITSVKQKGDTAEVSYGLGGDPAGAELFAVVAEDMVSSDVLRGENGGRKLTHVAVARNLLDLGTLGAPRPSEDNTVHHFASDGVVHVPVPRELRGGWHLVLFLQAPHQGRVLGVDTRALRATAW